MSFYELEISMKVFTKALLGMTVGLLVSHSSFAAEQLTVWEDLDKGHGIQPAIEAFEKEFNCKINLVQSDYVAHIQKLEEAVGNGATNLPDIVMLPADRLGDAAQKGLITPLNFMVSDRDIYLDSAVAAFTYNGQIFACPRSVETMVVYYNQDLMDYPFETMDEYYNFSIAMKNQGKNGVIGKWDNVYFVYGFIRGFGGYVFGKNGDGSLNPHDIGMNNSGAVMGADYLKNFVMNALPREVLGDGGWGALGQLFGSGRAAAIITGPWELEGIAKSGINYGVAPLPKLPNGNYMCPFLGFRGYVITKFSKNHDLAEKFLRYINQNQYALKRYEGIHEIPPVKSVMADSLIKNDDFANAVSVQALNAEPMPSIPEMAQVWGPMNDAISDIVTGKVPTKQALDDGVAKIKAAIGD